LSSLVWPPRAVVDYIARHIAGEIVLSNRPGNVMRKWRELFGTSQLEVAHHMGVSPSVISDYEKGRRVPGSSFVRRFVEALIEIDAEHGWVTVLRLAKNFQIHYLSAVIDMAEFEHGVRIDDVIRAVRGIPVNSFIEEQRVYGYTIVDSIKAVLSLAGNEFFYLLGSTSQRVVVFTKVTSGRSPMIALRVSTIKPAVIVLHGTRRLDYLAAWIAESENLPVILSTAKDVEELTRNLRALAFSPQ
jgi:putative transcriptional regulator